MPRKNRSGLTPAVIQHWRRTINPETGKPYRNSEIARMFRVSQQLLNDVIYRYGGVEPTPREQAKKMLPWTIPYQFARSSPPSRLRDHAEFMAGGGRGMDSRKLLLLRGFYTKLMDLNVVVEYDPDIPPSDGIASGGWAYREREEEDGDLIIRLNEHARPLTDDERLIWRMPPKLP